MSINRSMNRVYSINTHNGITQALKKNEIMLSAITWVDLEGIMLSEISQTEKDKYHLISLICEI